MGGEKNSKTLPQNSIGRIEHVLSTNPPNMPTDNINGVWQRANSSSNLSVPKFGNQPSFHHLQRGLVL